MGPPVRYRSGRGRLVLLATVLGSGMAFLDATVVNIALPSIGEDFDASLAQLQWTVNAYALTLAGLILIGGSLGDHLGRRRVFVWGVVWFAIASLLCAVAPTVEVLIVARAVQGVGAALPHPGQPRDPRGGLPPPTTAGPRSARGRGSPGSPRRSDPSWEAGSWRRCRGA